MTFLSLAVELRSVPGCADPDRARVGLERWLAAATATGDAATLARVQDVAADPRAKRLLDALFGNSPFLTFVAEREPTLLEAILRHGPDRTVERVMADVALCAREALSGVSPGRALRLAKRRLALTTAIADVCGEWSLDRVTRVLSDFADAAVESAATYLLAEAADKGILELPEPNHPTQGSGLIILGMGKLGGRELNYSSDIDIIVFYDTERVRTRDTQGLQHNMLRLTRALVRLLSDRTADGYVFRTDLRLRPDPGATPAAISVLAAEEYYGSIGQNWERAALIKARPIAGDIEAGQHFLAWLRPFIWRKNLDFAAIEDIHSIKRQINAHRGGGTIRLPGHNIKLGRGGIREIEFFAQTQQLIWGGRLPSLRVSRTVDALVALADAAKIDHQAAGELADAYARLRRTEHRLQMINDEQTHELPTEAEKLRQLAVFAGYDDAEAFGRDILATLRLVESYYAELFEDAPALTAVNGGAGGNLVFTGGEVDPDTLETLGHIGFLSPKTVDAIVRGWHHGRYRATHSTRARELLTAMMPLLLKHIAHTPDPDATLMAFDRFLARLPAGVQLFAMFTANPDLLALLVKILGFGAGMADVLAGRPAVLERVISAADFFQPLPPLDELEAELADVLRRADDWEEVLDASRRWASECSFQVSVQHLLDRCDIGVSTDGWSDIAEACVRQLKPRVEADFALSHGRVDGCDFAVVAMGKLGSREMTVRSDLDLIFVYTTPPDGAASDGPRPVPAAHYFARLSQRMIAALTAPTAEGRLFEVDMRLRPSGKAGPIAVSAESFRRYQLNDAWTWEHMALTRARLIAGPPALVAEIEAYIRASLTRRRDERTLVTDVAEMRGRMAREHPGRSIWDVKHVRGGLVDVEFITQYLQLLHGHAHPEVLAPSTAKALRRLRRAGLLDITVAADLLEGLSLWHAVQCRLRLAFSGPVTALAGDDAPKPLRLAVKGLCGLEFDALVDKMQRQASCVHKHFVALVEQPAAVAAHAATAE
jgi:Glutamine synthetase adenylyltransferase